MKAIKLYAIVLILLMGLGSSSCLTSSKMYMTQSVFRVHDLPIEEIVVLRLTGLVDVHSVDWETIPPGHSSLALTPGNHSLVISIDGVYNKREATNWDFGFRATYQVNEIIINIDVIAGHSYSFVCRTDYIVSENRHIPRWCGIQDDASSGATLIWERVKHMR